MHLDLRCRLPTGEGLRAEADDCESRRLALAARKGVGGLQGGKTLRKYGSLGGELRLRSVSVHTMAMESSEHRPRPGAGGKHLRAHKSASPYHADYALHVDLKSATPGCGGGSRVPGVDTGPRRREAPSQCQKCSAKANIENRTDSVRPCFTWSQILGWVDKDCMICE